MINPGRFRGGALRNHETRTRLVKVRFRVCLASLVIRLVARRGEDEPSEQDDRSENDDRPEIGPSLLSLLLTSIRNYYR